MGKINEFLKNMTKGFLKVLKDLFKQTPEDELLEKYVIIMKKYHVNYVKSKKFEINFVEHIVKQEKEALIGFQKAETQQESDDELLFWSSNMVPKRKGK